MIDIDEFVIDQMRIWRVPGLALAVVKDGKVVHARGYGHRDVASDLPVTTRTAFPIASVSKSFTATVLAKLAGAGKLEWDKPLRDYLSDFRLSDAFANDRITVRDLITHQSGLPRHDWIWYNTPLSREEICARLRHLEPSCDLRRRFQYNNLGYVTAGYLAGLIAGSTWEQLVTDTILGPLGMNLTSFSIEELLSSDDFSFPYGPDNNDDIQLGDFQRINAISPAGGINASIDDMARYLAMHIDGGVFDGRTILDEDTSKEIQTPQVVIREPIEYPEVSHKQYGMGFYIGSYRGNKHVWHDGGLRGGFSSILSFLPNSRFGAVVLCNLSPAPIPRIVANRVLDQLLNVDPLPWSERALTARAAEAAKVTITTPGDDKIPFGPGRRLDDYAGEYTHPAYGTVSISVKSAEDGKPCLHIACHGFFAVLNHRGFDIFETPPDKRNRLDRTQVRFEQDWDGNISRLCIPFEPSVSDIQLVRLAHPPRGD